jgi:futalosine hydrolase
LTRVRILVVAATDPEVAPFVAGMSAAEFADARMRRYTRNGHGVDVLVTGLGMVATGVWSSRVLAGGHYDLALNFGVCGAFDRALAPGTVVHVVSDCLPELGAEDGDAFLTMQQLSLIGPDDAPFTDGRLVNRMPPDNSALRELPAVDGITVNTVHGDEQSIARVLQRARADVESMEGAAFMYACLTQRVPFAQVRAVSNTVERRNRAAWKLAEAIDTLGATALRIIDHA